ncbi:hypothetical protein [Pseudomonas putida]|uniref:hypothetical protein n=1 Tax=Pseudomonas putida TaxID=303 RepID=UPI000F7B3974|nr:hypothetical protein [Pseudomonas putida]
MDRMVWAGCVLLFLAGGIYFNILPLLIWKKEVSAGDVVGGISAIAAACAAYASWKAANISKQSAEDSKLFTRAQLYMSHRQDFVDLVDYLSQELDVVFVRKYELYQRLFPRNHYSGNHFDAYGNQAVLDDWAQKYKAIVEATTRELSDVELDIWIMACIKMGEDLQFEFKPQKGPKIYLFAETPSDSIVTGFTSDPTRQVFYFGEVMNRIYAFCGRQPIELLLMDGHKFQVQFKEYFLKISSKKTCHRVFDPDERFETTR